MSRKKKSTDKVVPLFKNADGLVNLYTGLGTSSTKNYANVWNYGVLNDFGQLEACYEENWIARRIVDVVADDVTANWRTLKSEYAEDIRRLEDTLGVKSSVNEAYRWARLSGGSGILMLTGQDLSKPLNLDKIKKGDLERLIVFDRWSMSATQFNTSNILQANFLRPEFYNIAYGGNNIHYSHFALFYGEPLPLRLLSQTNGWGDSVLRKCIDQITKLQASVEGIAELLEEANVDIIRAEGLGDGLAGDQAENIKKRYELLRQGKSNFKITLLDKTEEYERRTLNLSGVDSAIQMQMTMVAGSDGIPITRLFGTSAKGMNATGEGDMRDYDDKIISIQRGPVANSMAQLDQVLVRSAIGSFPDEFNYEWNPLREDDDLNTANAEFTRAQKHIALKDAGFITVSQGQRQLQANEEYQFKDEDIEELEQLEEPNLFNRDPESGAVETPNPFDV